MQGQANIFGQSAGLATSQTVNGVPIDGNTVYVKLWTLLGSTWQFNEYTYRASGASTKAVMTSPVTGSGLSGSGHPGSPESGFVGPSCLSDSWF